MVVLHYLFLFLCVYSVWCQDEEDGVSKIDRDLAVQRAENLNRLPRSVSASLRVLYRLLTRYVLRCFSPMDFHWIAAKQSFVAAIWCVGWNFGFFLVVFLVTFGG
jgi:hypothetical protein